MAIQPSPAESEPGKDRQSVTQTQKGEGSGPVPGQTVPLNIVRHSPCLAPDEPFVLFDNLICTQCGVIFETAAEYESHLEPF